MKLTTWLPSQWPPTPQTVWTRYAYGLDVTLDGSAGVSAPFARIERHTGEDRDQTLIPMERKLRKVATHPVRPHDGWNYTLEDEKRLFAMALALTAAPPAEARGTLGLASYYKSCASAARRSRRRSPRDTGHFSRGSTRNDGLGTPRFSLASD